MNAKQRAENYMRLKDDYKPLHKFNNGRGATLCNECNVIISEGLIKELLCEKCKQKQTIIEIMKQDEKDELYEE